MTPEETRKKLNDITKGIMEDIYKCESYYYIVKTISDNAICINRDRNNFGLLFGTIQRGLNSSSLLAISRLYDRSNNRSKTRSLEGLLNFLEKNAENFPQIVEIHNLKKQLLLSKISIDYVFADNDMIGINRRLINWLRTDTINRSEIRQRLKVIRDKRLSHNETVSGFDSPTWSELMELIELSKTFLGIIGWAYLNIAYKIDENYDLTNDAKRPSMALTRLLSELKIIEDH